ncbi:MAG: chorismate synthase [Planctomycetes bacterium RBG_16_43_13]|nr:MAG: chorismate synthase [Planctomycetes bacterium RBG_16_43_13]
MTTLSYITTGESHGKCLTAVISDVPYGTSINEEAINIDLARRQGGYGRGARMKMEKDTVEILTGIRHGKSLGNPITLMIKNNVSNIEELGSITKPRPGHTDLAGAMKYGLTDARDISERASARETVARVAAGSLAKQLLSLFNVEVCGYVVSIGNITSNIRINNPSELRTKRDASLFYCPEGEKLDEKVKQLVDETTKQGNTLGGTFEVVVFNAPPGLGNFTTWDGKLDGRLAYALMSIQTVKGVEIGSGFQSARMPGSEVHDEIVMKDNKIIRKSNNAGGIEGGITNGEPIVVRAACKPISTLLKPLATVDLTSKKEAEAQYERSDVCVVPAASVIGEAVVAFEIAAAFLEKFGGDTLEEVKERYNTYLDRIGSMFYKK